jgi:peptide methionine sulfoxide reductase MsrA
LKCEHNYYAINEISDRKEVDKLTIIYLIGFLALGLISTLNASGAETGSDLSKEKLEKATFAGGCFWCMEPPFDKLDGVISTTSGYCGGKEKNPTYKQVSAGETGHAEAVEILYDPSRISYAELLDFYHNEEQRQLAETSKKELGNSGRFNKEIVTEIVAATPFYRAEEYHQDYHKKNPLRYKIYRYGSGRDDYLVRKWGKK